MKGGNNIDAGYVAHPSFVESDELSAIKGPLSIAAAGMIDFPLCTCPSYSYE